MTDENSLTNDQFVVGKLNRDLVYNTATLLVYSKIFKENMDHDN